MTEDVNIREDANNEALGLEALRQEGWSVWHTAKKDGVVVARPSIAYLVRVCRQQKGLKR